MAAQRWLLVGTAGAVLAAGALALLRPTLPVPHLSTQRLLSSAKRKLPARGYLRFRYQGASQPFRYAFVDGNELRVAPSPAGLRTASPVMAKTASNTDPASPGTSLTS